MRIWQIIFYGFFLISSFIPPALADNQQLEKFVAVQEMVGMVKREEAQFVVMLRGYTIGDRYYHATLLNVSPSHTDEIKQTNDGFEGYFKFPKEIIHEEARAGNLINDRIVRVKVKIKLQDISVILGLTRAGKQFNVYPK